MDINNLTPEEKAQLFAQLEADKAAQEQKKQDDIEAYKELKDETVKQTFQALKKVSDTLLLSKECTFKMFEQIIKLKDDLYNTKTNRQSDTFTTTDGNISIKLGNRVYEGWDDTVEVGVQKVREYLKTLARDENSANLVDTVMGLLAKDRKGNLKANKVLELEKLASKSGNEDFKEGLKIIKEAYRPTPSCQFVEVKYKDENGKEQSLPLSMSAIEF
jgi:hypothetical protein